MSRPLLSVEQVTRTSPECSVCCQEISRGDLRVRFCRGQWTKFIHAYCVPNADIFIYFPSDPFAVVFEPVITPAERRQFMSDLATLPSQSMRRMRRLLCPLEIPRSRGQPEFGVSRYLEARARVIVAPRPQPPPAREPARMGGVPQRLLAQLPRYLGSTRTGEDSSCSICLEVFRPNDELMRLPCFHEFHAICVIDWLKKNRCCPVDKVDIVESTKY